MLSVESGDRVGDYVLEEALGRGGFGEVWKAHHYDQLDQWVAIKLPRAAAAVRELSNGGIVQAKLDHPGIAKCIGFDVQANPPYFVMEYVAGLDLRQILLQRQCLPADEVKKIIFDILDALEYAHNRGVVHRDLKPANIIASPKGRVVLTDFGLSQATDEDSMKLSQTLRSDSKVSGTFAYLAPEVRDQEEGIDGRADLYSLGVLMFELLTGKLPAGNEQPSDLKNLPIWCDRVFQGLYSRQERRLIDVTAVREVLEDAFEAPTASRPERQKQIQQNHSSVRVTPLSPPTRRLLTDADVCRILGYTSGELDLWVSKGELSTVTIGGKRLFESPAVFAFRTSRPSHAGLSQAATRIIGQGRSAQPGMRGGYRRAKLGKLAAKSTRGKFVDPNSPSAGFLLRGLAMVVDFWVVVLLVGTPLSWGPHMLLAPIVVFLLYHSLCLGVYGQTLGKLLFGIRVVKQDGQSLSVADGFVRTVNYFLSFLSLGLGFLCVLVSPKNLALHDYLCSTMVVKSPRDPAKKPRSMLSKDEQAANSAASSR